MPVSVRSVYDQLRVGTIFTFHADRAVPRSTDSVYKVIDITNERLVRLLPVNSKWGGGPLSFALGVYGDRYITIQNSFHSAMLEVFATGTTSEYGLKTIIEEINRG